MGDFSCYITWHPSFIDNIVKPLQFVSVRNYWVGIAEIWRCKMDAAFIFFDYGLQFFRNKLTPLVTRKVNLFTVSWKYVLYPVFCLNNVQWKITRLLTGCGTQIAPPIVVRGGAIWMPHPVYFWIFRNIEIEYIFFILQNLLDQKHLNLLLTKML